MLETIYDIIFDAKRYLPFSKAEEWLLFINEEDLWRIWSKSQLDPPAKFWTLAEQKEEAKKIKYLLGYRVISDWEKEPMLVHIDLVIKGD